MADQPPWQPPVPPGPPVPPPPAPEKPVFRAPPPPAPAPAPAEPEPPPPKLPLASWGSRAAAWFIDTLVMLGIATLVFFFIWAINGRAGTAGVAAAIAWGGAEYFFRGIVYAPLLMARTGRHNGQTLGKQAIGIRVVRESSEPMDYWSAFLRQWLVIVVLFQFIGGVLTGGLAPIIDVLWPLWDSRNRAVHDIVCSTLVFRT